MQKKFIAPIALVLSVVVLWMFFGGNKDEVTELYTSPRQGEFVVQVISTG